ncbi:MAG TPA: ArsR family transcriptional regulator [Methanoregulaceae archaeon]|nr:ArsR family transcriptional regulator [Methanoregulaceae archaeon]
MFKILNTSTIQPFELLVWLGRQYRQSFYVRELAKKLSMSVGAASGYLTALREMDLVTSEKRGRTLLYRANISHPVVREAKIFSTLLELSPLISAIKTMVSRAILFGSCAEGEDTFESDIDLFVEARDHTSVSLVLSHYEVASSRKISPLIVTPEDALQLKVRDRPLYERIQRGKVLVGEEL